MVDLGCESRRREARAQASTRQAPSSFTRKLHSTALPLSTTQLELDFMCISPLGQTTKARNSSISLVHDLPDFTKTDGSGA